MVTKTLHNSVTGASSSHDWLLAVTLGVLTNIRFYTCDHKFLYKKCKGKKKIINEALRIFYKSNFIK